MPRRAPLTAAVAVTALAASCGGSGAVGVDVPAPGPRATASCAALRARLPDRVDGQSLRATDPVSDLVSAWGDPAVVLRCGVGRPAELRPTSQLVTVDGVDWLPVALADGGYVFTTTGRLTGVEVSVPDSGEGGEAGVLVDFARAVKAAVPRRGVG